MMEPVSDEDVSDFGDEPDLPSGADGAGDRVQVVKPPSPVQAEVEEHDDDEDDTDQ